MHNRFFVTGTDTGIGKTCVSAALLRLMVRAGQQPFAFKPYESGLEPGVLSDSERLRVAAGGHQPIETVSLHRFRAPLAPAMAARREKRKPSWALTLKTFTQFSKAPGVVEGAGGLHVPLDAQHDVIDLIVALKTPVVLVARAGLGTINHTTLSLNELLRRQVSIAAVLLTQASAGADLSIRDNQPELQRRFGSIRFLKAVPFIAAEKKRAAAFEHSLKPLIAKSP